jgi:outer membrane receptor protein involved in Fe transport
VLIRPGVAELDFLGGSAAGNRGGRPRHEVELQAGVFKDGFGARLTGTWQEGTTITGAPTVGGTTRSDLFFSDSTSVNLRLFANLGQMEKLVRDVPFFRGTRVTLAVNNLFDSRPEVRDESGATPLGYQPGLLDPLGRSVRISLRKMFF